MNKIERNKSSQYTTISNVFLKDKNLSIKAKGFLAVIMGLPEKWDFSIKGICTILKEGKTAVYSVIQELKEHRYCKTKDIRDEKGLYIGLDYVFYEEPYIDNPNQDYPYPENRYADNETQYNNDNNKEKDNKKENKDNKLSLSKKGEELPNWKTDFKAYLALVYDAKEKLLANMSVKAKKLEYYPNINYELTIEKMVDDFWGTEEGWKNKIKVSKKSKTIDMVKTLVKGFDYTQNRVYKSIKSGGYSNNYTNTYQQPNNGSNRLIDGENKDGTYNRNGYRYYYSMRDDREYSIPINAEPMPSIDYEFDMTTKKWIPPTTNNNVNGNLW